MGESLDTVVLRRGRITVFGHLSSSVLCLLFLSRHRVLVETSNKQGLIGEFCTDLGQKFLGMG